jgi:FAD:protein FMN transferase
VLTTRITAPKPLARSAEARLLTEVRRLEAIFSAFVPESELNRWKRGDHDVVSEELAALLRAAHHWHAVSGGVFNPAVGLLSERWQQAEHDGILATPEEVLDLAEAIGTLPYSADGQRTGDCRGLNFNAFAKGMVVDLATNAARCVGVEDILVNIGGDLLHLGSEPVLVGVEDPRRPYDNVPPLTAVEFCGQGMATSGLARRGYRIGTRWLSHVIDPRTGWPTDAVASASVVARDAATADVIATVLSVLDPTEGMAWLANTQLGPDGLALGQVACGIIDSAGVMHTNAAWDAVSRPTGT